jgi:hypothetical protein
MYRSLAKSLPLALWVCLSCPSEVRADGDRALLFLMTETVLRLDQQPETRFWWSQADQPDWTQTDEELANQLKPFSVMRVGPSGGDRVSSIYRRSDLSQKQQLAFATVLGAGRVLGGEVVYEETVLAFPMMGVGCHARVQVGLRDTESATTQSINLQRTGYGADWGEASGNARRLLVKGLTRSVASSFGSRAVPTGLADDIHYLEVVGARNLAQVNAIERHLDDLPFVKEAMIRWVGPSRIAFELNPGDSISSSEIAAAVESLVDASFPGFRLAGIVKGHAEAGFTVRIVPEEVEEVDDGS